MAGASALVAVGAVATGVVGRTGFSDGERISPADQSGSEGPGGPGGATLWDCALPAGIGTLPVSSAPTTTSWDGAYDETTTTVEPTSTTVDPAFSAMTTTLPWENTATTVGEFGDGSYTSTSSTQQTTTSSTFVPTPTSDLAAAATIEATVTMADCRTLTDPAIAPPTSLPTVTLWVCSRPSPTDEALPSVPTTSIVAPRPSDPTSTYAPSTTSDPAASGSMLPQPGPAVVQLPGLGDGRYLVQDCVPVPGSEPSAMTTQGGASFGCSQLLDTSPPADEGLFDMDFDATFTSTTGPAADETRVASHFGHCTTFPEMCQTDGSTGEIVGCSGGLGADVVGPTDPVGIWTCFGFGGTEGPPLDGLERQPFEDVTFQMDDCMFAPAGESDPTATTVAATVTSTATTSP